jgi:hypothetical protein
MKAPPSLVFVPDVNLIRTMAKANLMYAKTERLSQFLLRFGLIDETITDKDLYFQYQ